MADLLQDEWVEKLEKDNNAFILDVRTPEEVDQGQIPDAINLNIYLGPEFLEELKKLDKSMQVILNEFYEKYLAK